MAQSLTGRSRTLVMRLVDVVVGVRPGHVLVTHSSMIASVIATIAGLSLSLAIVTMVAHSSMIASVIASMIASVIATVAGLSLSLAIVTMVIAMKTLWTPMVVAGGMTISIARLSISLSLVIIASSVTRVVVAVAVGGRMIAVARLSLSLSLSLAIVAETMQALRTPVAVAAASVWMIGSSIAIARLSEGHGGQRENL